MSGPDDWFGQHRSSTCRGSRTGCGATTSSRSTAGARWCSPSIPATTRPGARGRCARTATSSRCSRALEAVLLGISPQDVDSHEKWAQKRNLQFPLLADTDRAVAKEYGVAAPVIGIRRSVFVVDAAGVLRYKDMKIIGAIVREGQQARRHPRSRSSRIPATSDCPTKCPGRRGAACARLRPPRTIELRGCQPCGSR